MTHYTIHYEGGDESQLDEQALADMREYMGDKSYNALYHELIGKFPRNSIPVERLEREWFAALLLSCAMAGVSGRPVSAYKRMIIDVLGIK